MAQARIRIDGREHFIPSGHDVEAIMSTITEQVRAGGGFVKIFRTPDRELSVLVSPGMSLSIEVTLSDDESTNSRADYAEPWWAKSSLDLLDMA